MTIVSLYEKLLTAYPRSYHDEYAAEMTQLLQDMLTHESRKTKRALIISKAYGELPFRLATANLQIIRRVYASETPNYVTANSRISLGLLMPLFGLLVFNEIRPDNLPATPSAVDAMQFMAIGLPGIATILSLATIAIWCYSRHKDKRSGLAHELADVRHNWPLLAIAGFATFAIIFIAGHDAIGCLRPGPIDIARNINTTLQCVEGK